MKSILTDRALSENLAPMLASFESLQSADLVDRAWSIVEQFLPLEPKEAEYIANIQRGKVLPQLLFSAGSEDARKIAEHPAILWKVLNVRDHLRKQNKKGTNRVTQGDVKKG
jgi:hypothetical protein